MADKEVLYRIEFEGAKEQLKVLADIREELDNIAVEQVKSDKSDKVRQEELKLVAKQQQENYRKTQQAIKDQANAQKAVAGSLEDLRIKARQYTKELEKLPIGTKEFANQANKVELVNRQIRNADKSAGNFKTNIGNYAGSIGDAFQGVGLNVGKLQGTIGSLGAATAAGGPLGIGLAAIAGGVQLLGGALSATDDIADSFERTIQGAKAATDVFFKAIATGDFSNLIGNMREAVKIGQKYADTLDRLEDKKRAQDVQEAKARADIAKLKKELKDPGLDPDLRKKKAQEILTIEQNLANKRVENAEILVNAELEKNAALNKLSKSELKDLIENFDAYEKRFDIVAKLVDAEKRLADEKARSGGGASGFEVSDPKEVARLTKIVEGLRNATADYSKQIIAFGSVAGGERDKVKDALVEWYNELASFDERTLRTETSLNSLENATNKAGKGFKNQANTLSELNTVFDAHIQQWEKLNEQLKRAADSQDDLGLFARSFNPKGYQADKGNIGGLRTGAGTANLPPAPGEDEAARVGIDIQATTDAASMFVNIWTDAYAMKDEALRESLNKGLISEKQYNEESAKLQKKANNLQRLSVIAQLSGDLAKTLSALGVGAANTAKVGFPLNIPLLIAFAAQAAGILSNLRSIKFAEGGLIAGGKPHSQGGTKYVGSDGSAFEAERGEYIAVVNKHDTKRLGELSNLNSRHGRSFYGQPNAAYFAQGGIFSPNQNIGNNQQESMIRAMVNQIGSIPVEVSLNEIEKKSDLKRKVNTIGSL